MKTKDEIIQLIVNAGSCESIEEIRAKLVDLQSEVENDYTEHEKIVQERDELKLHNDKLTKANMELYLKSGSSKGTSNNMKEQEPEKLSFDQLFNEKGELK